MFKHISVKVDPQLTRVNCFKNYFGSNIPEFTFWIPTSSLDEHGHVPSDVIRARIKHAFGANQGHFTYTREL
jgi:hypothetical protein